MRLQSWGLGTRPVAYIDFQRQRMIPPDAALVIRPNRHPDQGTQRNATNVHRWTARKQDPQGIQTIVFRIISSIHCAG